MVCVGLRANINLRRFLKSAADADEAVAAIQAAGSGCTPVNPLSEVVEAFGNSRGNEPNHVPSSETRPSIEGVLTEIQGELWYNDQIKHTRLFEAKEARTGMLTRPYKQHHSLDAIGVPEPRFSTNVKSALLDSRNIDTLYSHQAAAVTALSDGKDVIVSTSTASGKSVIYQVNSLALFSKVYGLK
jgi:DEAD/DEAH box helicase domain-containing protein